LGEFGGYSVATDGTRIAAIVPTHFPSRTPRSP
jgi:hypothetical protein